MNTLKSRFLQKRFLNETAPGSPAAPPGAPPAPPDKDTKIKDLQKEYGNDLLAILNREKESTLDNVKLPDKIKAKLKKYLEIDPFLKDLMGEQFSSIEEKIKNFGGPAPAAPASGGGSGGSGGSGGGNRDSAKQPLSVGGQSVTPKMQGNNPSIKLSGQNALTALKKLEKLIGEEKIVTTLSWDLENDAEVRKALS